MLTQIQNQKLTKLHAKEKDSAKNVVEFVNSWRQLTGWTGSKTRSSRCACHSNLTNDQLTLLSRLFCVNKSSFCAKKSCQTRVWEAQIAPSKLNVGHNSTDRCSCRILFPVSLLISFLKSSQESSHGFWRGVIVQRFCLPNNFSFVFRETNNRNLTGKSYNRWPRLAQDGCRIGVCQLLFSHLFQLFLSMFLHFWNANQSWSSHTFHKNRDRSCLLRTFFVPKTASKVEASLCIFNYTCPSFLALLAQLLFFFSRVVVWKNVLSVMSNCNFLTKSISSEVDSRFQGHFPSFFQIHRQMKKIYKPTLAVSIVLWNSNKCLLIFDSFALTALWQRKQNKLSRCCVLFQI